MGRRARGAVSAERHTGTVSCLPVAEVGLCSEAELACNAADEGRVCGTAVRDAARAGPPVPQRVQRARAGGGEWRCLARGIPQGFCEGGRDGASAAGSDGHGNCAHPWGTEGFLLRVQPDRADVPEAAEVLRSDGP